MDREQLDRALAEANVSRIRGELPRAEKLLRSILESEPTEADALIMLSEVCADLGQFEEAHQALERAANAHPHVELIRRRREQLKRRMADRDVAQLVSDLGLPTTRGRAKWWAIGSALFVFSLALFTFFWGQRMSRRGTEFTAPIELQSTQKVGATEPEPEPTEGNPSPVRREPAVTIVDMRPDDDKELLGALKSKLTNPNALVGAAKDKRNSRLTLLIHAEPGEEYRTRAAAVAAEVLGLQPDSPQANIRVEQGGKIVFEADLVRADLDVKNEDGSSTDPAKLLRDEWMRQSQ